MSGTNPNVGNILWSAFAAEDGSGCYSSPQRVKVVSVKGALCQVQEKTSYGWSNWRSIRRKKDLHATEWEAWLYLATKFPSDGIGGYCFMRAKAFAKETTTK